MSRGELQCLSQARIFVVRQPQVCGHSFNKFDRRRPFDSELDRRDIALLEAYRFREIHLTDTVAEPECAQSFGKGTQRVNSRKTFIAPGDVMATPLQKSNSSR